MADDRDRTDPYKPTGQPQYSQGEQQQSAFDDLEAGADDVDKVKGGARPRAGDPCDGGE